MRLLSHGRILLLLLSWHGCGDGASSLPPDGGPPPDAGQADSAPPGDKMTIPDQVPEGTRPDARPDEPIDPSCPVARTGIDLPDDSTLYQVRPLYVLPADRADEALDTNGRICTSVRAATRWLGQQTGGRALRLDTMGGMLDIGFFQLTKTDAELKGTSWELSVDHGYQYVIDRVQRELTPLGVFGPNKLYMVFYGGSSIYSCGGAAYPPWRMGQVAMVYLKGQPQGGYPCEQDPWGMSPTRPAYLDYAILHDTFHALGIVDDAAPHEHSSGHVFDGVTGSERDLMYQPRVEADPYWDTYNPAGLILDINRDDYFEHGKAGLVDLARSVFLSPLPAGASKPPGW